VKLSWGRFPFEIVLILIVTLLHGYAAFAPPTSLLNWYSTDDAFYYFKTAQNIAEGHGVTFDRIGLDSGFHPLWMLVCVPVFALARFDLVLPLRVLVLVSGFFSAGSAILLFRLICRVFSRPVAALTSALWLLTPQIHGVIAQMGMEAGISAFFILLTLYSASRLEEKSLPNARDLVLLGLSAALMVLSRLDNLFIAALLGVWIVLKGARFRLTLMAELSIFFLSVVAAFFLRLAPGAERYQYMSAFYLMLAAAFLFKPLLFLAFGLFSPRSEAGFNWTALRLFAAVGTSSLAIGLVCAAASALKFLNGFPRAVLFYDALLTLSACGLLRLFIAVFSREGADRSLSTWREWTRRALAFAAPLALLLGAYLLWNTLTFSSPSPVSGQIKQWWGSLPNTVYGQPAADLEGFLGFTGRSGPWSLAANLLDQPFDALMKTLSIPPETENYIDLRTGLWVLFWAAVFVLLRSNWNRVGSAARGLLFAPLFTACLLQVVSYMGTGYVNTRPWYWVSEMILFILLAGALLDSIAQMLSGTRRSRTLFVALAAVMLVWVGWSTVEDLTRYIPYQLEPGTEDAYLSGARGLEQTTEPGSRIGSTGGGVVAYFIQSRTVVNLDGLMNSREYFTRLKEGTASLYLDRIGLNYVYGNEEMITASDPYMGLFKNRLAYMGKVQGSALFRYLPGR